MCGLLIINAMPLSEEIVFDDSMKRKHLCSDTQHYEKVILPVGTCA